MIIAGDYTIMRIVFLYTLFFLLSNAQAQFQSIDKLIKGLNNTQFLIDHDHKGTFRMESKEAKKLIEKGTKASCKLIKALDDKDKIIMAHLVLSHIYYKKVSFAGPKVYVGETQDVNKYFLGEENGKGLIISEVKEHGKHKMYVEEQEREKIVEYWKKKTGCN